MVLIAYAYAYAYVAYVAPRNQWSKQPRIIIVSVATITYSADCGGGTWGPSSMIYKFHQLCAMFKLS